MPATHTEEPVSHSHKVVKQNSIYDSFNRQESAVGKTAQVKGNETYDPLSYEGNAAAGTEEIVLDESYESTDAQVMQYIEDGTYDRLNLDNFNIKEWGQKKRVIEFLYSEVGWKEEVYVEVKVGTMKEGRRVKADRPSAFLCVCGNGIHVCP